ncbi:hypothetical protein DPX16_10579 [Anabarilius grahami]|uniref:Uncharacterized protein n=1 Tax=Anabarilius grahami TaxID=495550 RepID=A0A3N0Z6T2_ANAGA|nr:hypothetical protein DPX16_10579 [Anabarilius grahami]
MPETSAKMSTMPEPSAKMVTTAESPECAALAIMATIIMCVWATHASSPPPDQGSEGTPSLTSVQRGLQPLVRSALAPRPRATIAMPWSMSCYPAGAMPSIPPPRPPLFHHQVLRIK